MAKYQVTLTFPEELLREPIIYNLGQQFNIVTNILQADVTSDRGWVILEIKGEDEDIKSGITWVTSKGVRVEPISSESTQTG
jgi:ABC-type methionine transport system ATPase subunit